MASNGDLLYRDLIIINELGLHARSAAKLAKTAQQAVKGVWVQLGDNRIDAKQVIDLLTLGAAKGDRVRVGIDAPGDMPTLNQIVALITDGFGE